MITEDDRKTGFWSGVRDCLPISGAGALFGFVFGVLTHTKGMSLINAVMMSGVVYAGAAQTVSISLWDPHMIPVFTLVGTVFVVCLRFILMGATLRPLLKNIQPFKLYLSLFILVDENWALTILKNEKEQVSENFLFYYFVGSGVIFYLSWVISTAIGSFAATYIQNPEKLGINFAFTAIFLGLLIGLWRGKRDLLPWIVAALVSIASAYLIPGTWYIMLGALAGSLVGVWREYH